MDAQLKAKWVEALRSGDYGQASGQLHDAQNGGFCCLGVLCKVMGAEFGPVVEDREEEGVTSHEYVPHIRGRVLGVDEELKASTCRELGIPNQFELIKMNDGFGEDPEGLGYVRQHSFSEIADYIEKNL